MDQSQSLEEESNDLSPRPPEPTDRASAHKLVDWICVEKNGFLDDAFLAKFSPDDRNKIRRSHRAKDDMIGFMIKTVAKDLYSHEGRFIFEMLQNADDNSYSRTTETPYVSFQIHPNQIIVECNEDGFNSENLEAISATGKSSKKEARGYIGNKGLGFKSVFKVARKAYIQSGYYSFFFEHDPHNRQHDGMGMISPVWLEPDGDLPGLTRITLSLHDVVKHDDILRQFEELPASTLLFLQKLKRIDISIYDGDGACKSSIKFSKTISQDNNHVRLRTVQTRSNSSDQITDQYFHVTTFEADGLAADENREYSDEQKTQGTYATAEVSVAFPLTESSEPIIERQDIFAFLPIRNFGFKFLIHADFVTSINRQDIVESSERNKGLRKGVADAFIQGIKELCEHPTLQFEWMRYLPQSRDEIWEEFWKELDDLIAKRLKGDAVDGIEPQPVLRTENSQTLRPITELRIVLPAALDRNSRPLFDDIEPTKYPSSTYKKEDLIKLRRFGLTNLTMNDFMNRLKADLARPTSRMHSSSTEPDWHSRVARSLCLPFQNDWNYIINDLKGLELLPTSHGWMSVKDNAHTLLYPILAGAKIPIDLPGILLIDQAAAEDPDRRKLFEYLGVKEGSVETIREKILARYQYLSGSTIIFDVDISRSHLEFLYHTCDGQTQQYGSITVFTELSRPPVSPSVTRMYFPDDKPYSAYVLLEYCHSLEFDFLHDKYLSDPPGQSDRHGQSWTDWLQACIGIRRQIELVDSQGITVECRHIAETLPEKFLEALRHHLTPKQKTAGELECDNVAKALRDTNVLCDGNAMRTFSETYLPRIHLEEICNQFMNEDEPRPFLKLENSLSTTNHDWDFLLNLGVRDHEDVDFYLAMLVEISTKNPKIAPGRKDEIAEIYRCLYHEKSRKISRENGGDIDKRIRNIFEEKGLMLVHSMDQEGFSWAKLSQCRLDAPEFMRTLHSPLGPTHVADSAVLEFLEGTLNLRKCSCKDYMDELQAAKTSGIRSLAWFQQLYTCLNELDFEKEGFNLKGTFQKDALIFLPSGWHKVSQCVWASKTKIHGRFSLHDHYPGLEKFFLENLGVEELNMQMVYEELKMKGSSSDPDDPGDPDDSEDSDDPDEPKDPDGYDSDDSNDSDDSKSSDDSDNSDNSGQTKVAEVKDLIFLLNSFLECNQDLPDPKPIRKRRVFPVRYPKTKAVKLCPATTEFAINDRDYLKDSLIDEARLLDFTLEEVHTLKPFLQWVGFESQGDGSRYLSAAVKEITTIHPDSHVSRVPERGIKGKAHALFRIAVHFRSPRVWGDGRALDVSLYKRLQQAEVSATDGITSELRLRQGEQGNPDREIVVTLSKRELTDIHLDDDSDIKIFLPRDRKAQSLCYASKLPRSLVRWMMNDPQTKEQGPIDEKAVRIVGMILSQPEFILSDLLDGEGISGVDLTDEHQDTEATGDFNPETEKPGEPQVPTSVKETSQDIGALTDSLAAIRLSMTTREESRDAEAAESGSDDEPSRTSTTSVRSGISTATTRLSDYDLNLTRHSRTQNSVSEPLRTSPDLSRSRRYVSEVEVPTTWPAGFYSSDETQEESYAMDVESSSPRQYRQTRQRIIPPALHPWLDLSIQQSEAVLSKPLRPRRNSWQTTDLSAPNASHDRADVNDDIQYASLLNRVKERAGKAEFPSTGCFDMSDLWASLPNDGMCDSAASRKFDVPRTCDQRERDNRIGAAGELFVFEMLCRFLAPSFNETHWQSNMRNYVNTHQNRRWEEWKGRERADIMYDDNEGKLTEVLIDKGYLPREIWDGRKPEYFLEVKTTTGPSDTRFFISKRQYQLIGEHTNGKDGTVNLNSIYVVLRVYNLMSDSIGLKVYVDPRSVQEKGDLEFAAEKWSVTPQKKRSPN